MIEKNAPEQVHLGIDTGTMLQVQVKGVKGKALSSLIGKEKGRYLIVHTPSIPGFLSKLRKGNQVIIRYVHEGIVFGFQCTLIHFIDAPFRISFLSYPESVQTLNLRSHKRISCFLPVSAKIGDVIYEGVLLDLSMSGCGFHYLTQELDDIRNIDKGESISFTLQLIGTPNELTIDATVRSIRLDTNKIVIGAQFNEMSAALSNEIENYIQKISLFKDLIQQ